MSPYVDDDPEGDMGLPSKPKTYKADKQFGERLMLFVMITTAAVFALYTGLVLWDIAG